MPLPDACNALTYQVRVSFGNGTTSPLPDNPASPYYKMYQGELVKLYCTDFETNPLLAGWYLAETNIASPANKPTIKAGCATMPWGIVFLSISLHSWLASAHDGKGLGLYNRLFRDVDHLSTQ